MTLGELAEASGLPARTIRYYIARGLLDGPVKGGRDAAYTEEHLARLERIKTLQSEGRTLLEIERLLSEGSEEISASPPTAWWQHVIADDIIVWVKADAAPWRMRQVRAAVDELARQVAQANKRTEKERGTR